MFATVQKWEGDLGETETEDNTIPARNPYPQAICGLVGHRIVIMADAI